MIKTTHTWKFGDCLNLLPEVPNQSIDLIITDLPYGLTRCAWDTPIDLNKLWLEYKRIIKDHGTIILTASQPYTSVLVMSNPKMFRYEWIWEKTQATGHLNANKMPMKAHENVLVFYKKLPKYNPQKTTGHRPTNSYTKYISTQNRSNIYGTCKKETCGGGNTDRYPRTVQIFSSDKQTSSLHEAQKPIALFEYLIKTYTDEGDWVHDSCLGSGPVLEACKNLNRNCMGFDLSDEWELDYKKRLIVD